MVQEEQAAKGEIGGWPMLSKRTPPHRMIARIDEICGVQPS
jgi:hypothetical protein